MLHEIILLQSKQWHDLQWNVLIQKALCWLFCYCPNQLLFAFIYLCVLRCRHVPFGLVRGMKTRSGEVVFLEDVLDEAQARMLHNMRLSKSKKRKKKSSDETHILLWGLIIHDVDRLIFPQQQRTWKTQRAPQRRWQSVHWLSRWRGVRIHKLCACMRVCVCSVVYTTYV